MLTKEKVNYWQIKTIEGTYHQPDSSEVIFQWIFENRIGTEDLVFSPEKHDWVPLHRESLLKSCFWQLRTAEGKFYGPVSLGELKQLFMNNQIGTESEVAPYGVTKQWLAIRDLPTLDRWLVGEYTQPLDYKQFLNKLDREFLSQEEIPKKISRKEIKFSEEIAELKQKVKTQEEQIGGFELARAQLEKALEAERQKVEEVRVKYDEIGPEPEALLNELQKLKSESREKTLFIEELNKQMAQMEVANTIKDDEIRELKEHLEVTTGDIPAQLELLQQRLHDEEERESQLQLEKEGLQQDVQEQKQVLLQKQEELEEDIKRLTNEKEGLQNFIYTLQNDLTKISSEKEQLEQIISEPTESLKNTINELTQAKDELKAELEEKDKLLKEYKVGTSDEINRLIEENKNLENRMQGLREETALLERKSDEISQAKGIKNAQIQALLKNKEQLMKALAVKEELISQLKEKLISKDGVYEVEQERFTQQSKDMTEELGYKEELIKRLEQKLDGLKWEYRSKVKESEDNLAKQAEQFGDELAQKTKVWEITFNDEKNKWEEIQQQIEGELAQTKAELESQVLEKERLQGEISDLREEWKDKLAGVQEEARNQYEELVQERENLQTGFANRLHELESEIERLQLDLNEVNKRREELLQDKDILQKELTQREGFIEEIKRGATQQEQMLRESEEALAKANNTIGEREDKITGLTGQLQDELETQNTLRGEVATINEELAQTRHVLEQLYAEKERFTEDLQRQKEDFDEKQKYWEQELEEAKHNWEHVIEENRTLQRQFYVEKQKLTKEYTEAINKQTKLEKRNQLEREITDRTRMKDELERLYTLLKGSFEELQKGSLEMQSNLQQLQTDIDNKRLSLKYLSEIEKRGEKKAQFLKPESTNNINKVNNTPAEE